LVIECEPRHKVLRFSYALTGLQDSLVDLHKFRQGLKNVIALPAGYIRPAYPAGVFCAKCVGEREQFFVECDVIVEYCAPNNARE
jgi:hypothetical protein